MYVLSINVCSFDVQLTGWRWLMMRLVIDETFTSPLEKRVAFERSIEKKRDQLFSIRNDTVDTDILRSSRRHSNVAGW